MAKKGFKGTWYVDHPVSQFNENVKGLAKEANLKIIDKKFKGKSKQCSKPPELTKKGS